jgi:hypothetical protein
MRYRGMQLKLPPRWRLTREHPGGESMGNQVGPNAGEDK